MCYSSTLYATLKPSYYPWPNLGPGSVAGIYSPGVAIFKHDLDHNCADLSLEDRRVVGVITVAAPRVPDLTGDRLSFKHASDLEDLRGKIRLVYRMAASNGNESVVLGALGSRHRKLRKRRIILAGRGHGVWRILLPFACGGTRNEVDFA